MRIFPTDQIAEKVEMYHRLAVQWRAVFNETGLMLDRTTVEAWLSEIPAPHTDTNVRDAGWVKAVGIDGSRISIALSLGFPADGFKSALTADIEQVLTERAEVESCVVSVDWKVAAHKVQGKLSPLPGVKNIIAVASGKGGVGKSTTSVNLALALAGEGASVGLLDADIYGPSQPRMMGISGRPDSHDGKTVEPKVNHGIQTMSIGYLIEEDTPMVWRGPMATGALQQLITETNWKGLDYLIVDMPPGTGDIQLTLAQKVPLSGAIIVTTPQDIALLDARKGLKMFEKVNVSVLGVVENMSTHICSNCGHEEPIFGAGGGQKMADDYKVRLLGQIPLDIRIREQTDSGKPTMITDPESSPAQAYRNIALRAAADLASQEKNRKIDLPKIVIQNT